MKIKVLQRGLLGIPLGIAIGYVITIITSLIWGNGYYSPCVPTLIEAVGSVIGAIVFQTVLCGLLGASFAAASVIWEKEDWSIAKQTGIHFLLTASTMIPIAYFAHWMEHSIYGVASYLSVFIVIFFLIWIFQYCMWKSKVRAINKKMAEMK